MKLNKLVIVLIVAVIGFFIYNYDKHNNLDNDLSVTKKNQLNSPFSKTQEKLSDILKESKVRKEIVDQKFPKTSDIEKCVHLEKLIISQSTQDYIQEINSLNNPQFCGSSINKYKGMKFEIVKALTQICDNSKESFSLDDCEELSVLAKGVFMYDTIKDKPLNQLTNDEVVQYFFGFIVAGSEDGTLDNEMINTMKSIVNEMDARFPGSPPVSKAKIFTNFMFEGESQNISQEAQELIDRAKELNPNDKDLIALDMHMAVHNNEPDVEKELKAYSADNPESGLGLYFEGMVAWDKGLFKKARRLLDQAIEREPKNHNFQHTLDKFAKNLAKHKKNPDKKLNPFTMTFNFMPNDF